MPRSLRSDGPHCFPQVLHLEIILSVAIISDGSVHTDDSTDVLRLHEANLRFGQIGGWRHFEPEVETEAFDVLCYLVHYHWLEIRQVIREKHSIERRHAVSLGPEACMKDLGEDADRSNHLVAVGAEIGFQKAPHTQSSDCILARMLTRGQRVQNAILERV